MFLPFSATHDIIHTSYSVKNEKHEKIVESTSTRKNVKNEIFFIFQKMISTAEITSQDATQTIFLHKKQQEEDHPINNKDKTLIKDLHRISSSLSNNNKRKSSFKKKVIKLIFP